MTHMAAMDCSARNLSLAAPGRILFRTRTDSGVISTISSSFMKPMACPKVIFLEAGNMRMISEVELRMFVRCFSLQGFMLRL